MSNEVKIHYEPFKEIAVLEYTRFNSPDDLARFLNVAAGGKATGVYWAKGVAFFYYPLSSGTETAAKVLLEQKKVYWAFLGYTLMPEYRQIIETKERIMIPVIDMSQSMMLQKAAEWMKQQP